MHRGRVEQIYLLVCALALASGVSAQPQPHGALSVGKSPSATITFIGAGDIASQAWSPTARHERTAQLIDQAITADPGTVVWTTGDNAYPDGTASNFSKYEQSWGRFRDRTRPTAGNHDWHTGNAQGYLDYFCPNASDCRFPGGTQEHYYSYDVGEAWHMIVLDSTLRDFKPGQTQYEWLKQDLQKTSRSCIVAYMHHPRFTSSAGRSNRNTFADIWRLLQQGGADVLLTGHDHHYERFVRQDADANLDTSGIIQIIVGSGGANLYDFSSSPQANSLVRVKDWGVLELRLGDTDFDWRFLDMGGTVRDSGTALCDPVTPATIGARINARNFPSIFQAWGNATNLTEDPLVTEARHDIVWERAEHFGLVWNNSQTMLATGFTPASITAALNRRSQVLALNPNVIFILNLQYRNGKADWLPADHEWWARDANGDLIPGWTGGAFPWFLFDFARPDLQSHIAQRASAAIDSGVFDGVLLDWWSEEAKDNRISLLRKVRAQIGASLIIVNANRNKTPQSAPFINGLFMEAGTAMTVARWEQIRQTLVWAEANLLEPRINCLEAWYETSRGELGKMRATTTLSLTLSDGYALFAEPNSVPGLDHRHDWYSFWDRSLGKSVSVGGVQADGSVLRRFDNGFVLYNPMGNGSVTIEFVEGHVSLATGLRALVHQLNEQDGDIFLK